MDGRFWRQLLIVVPGVLIVWVLLMLPILARAESAEPEFVVRVLECGPTVCMVVKADLGTLVEISNANNDRATKADEDLRKLREIKGCAKLEVTEPPRNFVPKKERDS